MLAAGDGRGSSRERVIVLGRGAALREENECSSITEKMSSMFERAGQWRIERMRDESEFERNCKRGLDKKKELFPGRHMIGTQYMEWMNK